MVKWPMSVLRLQGRDPGVLLEAMDDLYEKWKAYSDPDVAIRALANRTGKACRTIR
ncbi:hypothetical protein HMSSN036_32540 [Paenibacillus macerans]|nr:hypothetical protein HMSSN036_32540 [Paenibacillus macerans]